MKKVIVLFLLFLLLSCSSEKNENFSNSSGEFNRAPKELLKKYSKKINFKNGSNISKLYYGSETPCDNAASVGISLSYDFEFYRPKYNCESGFWFCGKWTSYWTCYDVNGNVIYQEEIQDKGNRIPKGKYSVEVNILESNEMILEFPKEQLLHEGYSVKNLSFFNVDDEFQVFPKSNLYFVKGDYPVYENEDKLIVLVKTKNL